VYVNGLVIFILMCIAIESTASVTFFRKFGSSSFSRVCK